jgi:hypothetical protein
MKRKLSKKYIGDLEFIKLLVDILNPKRASEFKPWIELGWCLHNIHNADDELLKKWIEFSKKDFRYLCTAEEECRKKWADMREEGLDIGTLRMWTKIDNKVEYDKLVDNDIHKFIEIKIQQNRLKEYDIAKICYKLFRYEYYYQTTNKIWYYFINHRWRELDSSEMRNNLSEIVSNHFYALAMNYVTKYNDNIDSADT